MTQQEFMEAYGDIELKFYRFYKFTFTFTGVTPDGKRILVHCGGDADSIYKWEVSADERVTVQNLYPFSGEVFDTESEVEVASFYER